MINDNNNKIVAFEKYCKDCQHKDTLDYQDPCNECMESPVNDGSEVPTKFERKKK